MAKPRSLKAKLFRVTKWVGLTREIAQPRVEQFVMEHATSGLTLDLGCGSGPYASYFPTRQGFDLNPSVAVDVLGDAHDLSVFEDNRFDCVLFSEVLEHLHTPQRAVDEIYRVLRPGGQLILTTRFVFPIHDAPGDYFRYTKYGLAHLLRRFEIVELREETNSLAAIAVLYQRIGFQCRTLGLLPLNIVWFLAARLTQLFSFLITREYGSKWTGVRESHVLTSGYHLLCRKPASR